jgi:cytochrome c
MSTLEINKIVGAILVALLVFVAISNIVRLTVGAEEDDTEPVFLVEVEADGEAAAATAVASEAAPAEETVAEADLAVGEKVFKKCAACHTVKEGDKHKIGPNLWDIVGAPRARRDDFKYSGTFRDLGGAWGYAALDAFLTKPNDYAPGTKMAFPGIKDAAERASVIAYLRSFSESPVPPAE